jgi:hypothetical protein
MMTIYFFLGKRNIGILSHLGNIKKKGVKSRRNAHNFLPNKTSLLLRLCDPVSSSHLHAFTHLSSPRLRRRLLLAGTLNGPRRRRALHSPHRGGGLPRLPRPPRGHDQGPHHRYATRHSLPVLRISPAYLEALLVLTRCLLWWFAQMWRSSTSSATPVSLLDLLGCRVWGRRQSRGC